MDKNNAATLAPPAKARSARSLALRAEARAPGSPAWEKRRIDRKAARAARAMMDLSDWRLAFFASPQNRSDAFAEVCERALNDGLRANNFPRELRRSAEWAKRPGARRDQAEPFLPLHRAAAEGFDERALRACAALGFSLAPSALDDHGGSPLHSAARSGSLQTASALLGMGADPAARSAGDGLAALHEAAAAGRMDAAEWISLLSGDGSLLRARTEKGCSPLAFAAGNGRTAMAQALLLAGAEIDAVDREGMTPLHEAVFGDRLECVRLLLARGASTALASKTGRTALHYALSCQRGEGFARVLIEHDGVWWRRDAEGFTPMHCGAFGETLLALLAFAVRPEAALPPSLDGLRDPQGLLLSEHFERQAVFGGLLGMSLRDRFVALAQRIEGRVLATQESLAITAALAVDAAAREEPAGGLARKNETPRL
jgi:hypothetical protein